MDQNRGKQSECQRFRQHRDKQSKKLGSDKKQGNSALNTKENVCPVSATSSNLSRNVITHVAPEQSAAIVKRRGGVPLTTSTRLPTSTRNRDLKLGPSDKSETKNRTLVAQIFEPGPPPKLNSLHRLNKQVSDVKSDLEVAEKIPDKEGLRLAEEKLMGSPRSNNNFQKTVSKRVDISPEEQLYSSLANLSVSSNSCAEKCGASQYNFWVASDSKKGRDPEPKLEWFHQPYEGTEVVCHASDEMLQSLMEESNRIERDIFFSTSATSQYKDDYDI